MYMYTRYITFTPYLVNLIRRREEREKKLGSDWSYLSHFVQLGLCNGGVCLDGDNFQFFKWKLPAYIMSLSKTSQFLVIFVVFLSLHERIVSTSGSFLGDGTFFIVPFYSLQILMKSMHNVLWVMFCLKFRTFHSFQVNYLYHCSFFWVEFGWPLVFSWARFLTVIWTTYSSMTSQSRNKINVFFGIFVDKESWPIQSDLLLNYQELKILSHAPVMSESLNQFDQL